MKNQPLRQFIFILSFIGMLVPNLALAQARTDLTPGLYSPQTASGSGTEKCYIMDFETGHSTPVSKGTPDSYCDTTDANGNVTETHYGDDGKPDGNHSVTQTVDDKGNVVPVGPTGDKFVSISQIPVFDSFAGAASLPAFLNQLYKICIGIAVVIAVLQLIRAGIMYSMGDSGFAKIEEAKHLITTSLLGLVLVLAPYIVFSIINPAILSLNINTTGVGPTGGSGPKDDAGRPATPVPTLPGGPDQSNSFACTGIHGNDCKAAQNKCATFYGADKVGKWDYEYGSDGNKTCRTDANNQVDPSGADGADACKSGEHLTLTCNPQSIDLTPDPINMGF